MYEKWPHGEQAKWWTHAERFDIMDQPDEFCWYIRNWYYVVVMLASHVATSSAGKGGRQKEDGQMSKDGQG
jgi:hypothetical protein